MNIFKEKLKKQYKLERIIKSPWGDLNPRPADYKSAAQPLSYRGDLVVIFDVIFSYEINFLKIIILYN